MKGGQVETMLMQFQRPMVKLGFPGREIRVHIGAKRISGTTGCFQSSENSAGDPVQIPGVWENCRTQESIESLWNLMDWRDPGLV